MAWEDSQRKEQVFRKIKLNQEIILKIVEEDNGKLNLIFSLKNHESITEIALSIDEWKSILTFLNSTDIKITAEFDKNSTESTTNSAIPVAEAIGEPEATPIVEPVATPIAEAISERVEIPLTKPIVEVIEKSTDSTQKGENSVTFTTIEAEPVATAIFDDLASEMDKVEQISAPEVPVVLSEEVITEILEKPARDEGPTLEESVISSTAEISPESTIKEEIEPSESSMFEEKTTADSEIEAAFSTPEVDSETKVSYEIKSPSLPTPPEIPKISQASKEDLENLLAPIMQPKISSFDEVEPDIFSSETSSVETPSSEENAEPSETPSTPQVSATELIDDITPSESINEPQTKPVMLNKADELLSSDEKEAKIIAAMEEVAALMPPGPAKKFVEEMMLKRTSDSSLDQPRIPQKFKSEDGSINN